MSETPSPGPMSGPSSSPGRGSPVYLQGILPEGEGRGVQEQAAPRVPPQGRGNTQGVMMMARGPRYKVPFRRRREGRTDYRHRAALLRGEKVRLVVRSSNRHSRVQFIEYKGGQEFTL